MLLFRTPDPGSIPLRPRTRKGAGRRVKHSQTHQLGRISGIA